MDPPALTEVQVRGPTLCSSCYGLLLRLIESAIFGATSNLVTRVGLP